MLGMVGKAGACKNQLSYSHRYCQTTLVPPELTPQQVSIIYASETDVLNMTLFGMTAAAWRKANPGLKGNIRDYATINELICPSDMKNINAVLINEAFPRAQNPAARSITLIAGVLKNRILSLFLHTDAN